MREIWQELGLIIGLAVVGFLSARFWGSATITLGAAAAIYLGWHLVNIVRLLLWLGHSHLRTPLSYGIWERIFDGLQSIELRSRKRKRDLRDFVRRLRLVINGMADAVVLLDDRARVRWFNPAAKRFLGLGLHTAFKRPVIEFLDHPIFVDQVNASLGFGPIDIPSPTNGAVILRIEVSELDGMEQRLLIARDITKTHNLERSRKDFVANVSHELRTPLTVFRGYLETLADDVDQQSDLAEPIAQMSQQATRMQDLVEDLLDLSRLESKDQASFETSVAVPELIRSIVEEARYLTEVEGREIEEEIDRELWLAGDAAILRIAFSNLIFNAVKHTNAKTRVVVEWGKEDGAAVFRVRDDGEGIPAHHLPRLTERFYRVNSARSRANGGTGLGLAIVKHALERHGAILNIESTLGRGATFSCHFSSARVIGARAASTASAFKPARTRKVPLH